MTYDYSALKGRIVSMYGNTRNYAKKKNYKEQRIYKILQGKVDVPSSMISAMCCDLDIQLEEVGNFFLTEKFTKAN